MSLEGALTLVTDPASEPLTAAEAKAHLRVTTADEDALIGSLITAARQRVEEITGLSLISQTWEYALNAFPEATRRNPLGAIWLPRGPLQSITSITYTDPDGDSQTLDAASYTADTRALPGQVVPAYGESWPSTRAVLNAVVVKYVGGFGDDGTDVPEPIRQALRIDLATLFEYRENLIAGGNVAPVGTVQALLAPYRVYWL